MSFFLRLLKRPLVRGCTEESRTTYLKRLSPLISTFDYSIASRVPDVGIIMRSRAKGLTQISSKTEIRSTESGSDGIELRMDNNWERERSRERIVHVPVTTGRRTTAPKKKKGEMNQESLTPYHWHGFFKGRSEGRTTVHVQKKGHNGEVIHGDQTRKSTGKTSGDGY